MTRRKMGGLFAGILVGVATLSIVGQLAAVGDSPQGSSERVSADGDPLVGKAFAESLGLPVIDPADPGSCIHAAEASPDETLYCLDSVVDSDREARLTGVRITGRMPLEEDATLFDLERKLASIPDTEENQAIRRQVASKIIDVMAELETATP